MINHKLSVSEFGSTSFFLVWKSDRWSLSKETQAGKPLLFTSVTTCGFYCRQAAVKKINAPSPPWLKHIKAKPPTHFHGTPLHCSLYNRCLLHCFDFSSHNNPTINKESFAIGRNQQLLDFTVKKAFREAIQNYKKEYVSKRLFS